MAGMTDLAIRIATTLDATGINKADKSVKKLDASVSKLGRTLGISLSTAAIVAYGKSAVKAYASMEAQQERLTRLLKVGVGASDFQVQALNKQAQALENLGVVSKGNVTQVQSQLATFNLQASTIAALTPAILDYVTAEKGAAASTEEFKSMTNGLAQALNGNFGSLTRVGFVIDKNTKKLIKNGSEAERVSAIVKVLDSTYKGFNASLRDTTTGKLQLLTIAAEDAKEVIGEGLVNALAKLGGGSDVQDAIHTLNTIAKSINTITNVTATAVGSLVKLYKGLDFITSFGGLTGGEGRIAKYADKVEERLRQFENPRSKSPAGTALRLRQAREAAAADRKAQALAKKQLDATKKLTAEQKKQAALKKAGTIFDMDQIQAIAALKGDLSKEERIRVEAMLALMNENEVLAQNLTKQILMAQDATGGLYRYFLTIGDAKIKNPFEFLDEWLVEFQNKLNNLKFPTMATATGVAASVAPTSGVVVGFTPPQGVYPTPSANAVGPQLPSTNVSTIPTGNFTYGQGNPLNTNVYVTVQGSVISEQDLTSTISKNLQNQSLSFWQDCPTREILWVLLVTLPAQIAVTFDFSSGATFGTGFVIGSPDNGVIGVNSFGSSDVIIPTVDLTPDVYSISIRRGRNIMQDTYEAGTCIVRVLDPLGYFNPQNTSSPYYGYLVPLRKLRVSATTTTTEHFLFSGYVNDYRYTFPVGQETAYVDILCTDGFRLLQMSNISTVTNATAGQDTGTRINKILDQVSFPASMRSISTGLATCVADPATRRSTLEAIKNAEFSEGLGAFYMSPDGTAIYKNRAEVTGSLGDTAIDFNQTTGIPYRNVKYAFDDKLIINNVTFTRVGGTTQNVFSQDSIDKYFPHGLNQENLVVETDAQVLGAAQNYVNTRRETTIRIDEMLVDLLDPDVPTDTLIGLDYFDNLNITNETQEGSTIQRTLQAQGFAWDITANKMQVAITTLEPIVDGFIIGSSTYGIIGQSTMSY